MELWWNARAIVAKEWEFCELPRSACGTCACAAIIQSSYKAVGDYLAGDGMLLSRRRRWSRIGGQIWVHEVVTVEALEAELLLLCSVFIVLAVTGQKNYSSTFFFFLILRCGHIWRFFSKFSSSFVFGTTFSQFNKNPTTHGFVRWV